MKEVVWVVGASASGKDTFIRNALSNSEVAKQLGWSGKIVAACEASRQYIGQSTDDPVVKQREQILSEAQILLHDADVVLIKWQYADIESSRPERLQKLLPDVRHRIIVLQAPIPELVDRLKKKAWWNEIGKEEDFIRASLSAVSEATANLKVCFEITRLDSGVNGGYRVIESSSSPILLPTS